MKTTTASRLPSQVLQKTNWRSPPRQPAGGERFHTAEQKERTYLYQGIAERNFERKFQLAENIHVAGMNLVNGLLFIELERDPRKRKTASYRN